MGRDLLRLSTGGLHGSGDVPKSLNAIKYTNGEMNEEYFRVK